MKVDFRVNIFLLLIVTCKLVQCDDNSDVSNDASNDTVTNDNSVDNDNSSSSSNATETDEYSYEYFYPPEHDPYYQDPVVATYEFEPYDDNDEYGEPFYPVDRGGKLSGDYGEDYGKSGNDTSNSTGEEEVTFQEYFVHQVSGFHTNQGPLDENAEVEEDEEEEEEKPKLNGDDLRPWEKEEGYVYNGGNWPTYPLFLIILGGLRHDMLDAAVMRNLTSFDYLRRHGSHVRRVKPVFPAEDYPVWTSLATGMYPEDHNIIGDVMYNLRTLRFFRRDDVESTHEGDWWKKVEPFWSTAAKHGRKVGI